MSLGSVHRHVIVLAAVAALGGCETVTTDAPVANGPSPVRPAAQFEEAPDARAASVLPVANVFGELPDTLVSTKANASEFGFQQHTFIDEGYDTEPAVSPDGKYVVFAST